MVTDTVCDSMMTIPELVVFTVRSIAALKASSGSACTGDPSRQETGLEASPECPS